MKLQEIKHAISNLREQKVQIYNDMCKKIRKALEDHNMISFSKIQKQCLNCDSQCKCSHYYVAMFDVFSDDIDDLYVILKVYYDGRYEIVFEYPSSMVRISRVDDITHIECYDGSNAVKEIVRSVLHILVDEIIPIIRSV